MRPVHVSDCSQVTRERLPQKEKEIPCTCAKAWCRVVLDCDEARCRVVFDRVNNQISLKLKFKKNFANSQFLNFE